MWTDRCGDLYIHYNIWEVYDTSLFTDKNVDLRDSDIQCIYILYAVQICN